MHQIWNSQAIIVAIESDCTTIDTIQAPAYDERCPRRHSFGLVASFSQALTAISATTTFVVQRVYADILSRL